MPAPEAAPAPAAPPPPADLVNVQIDGVWHKFPKGTRMIEACKQVQKEVPHYCYHEALSVVASCRMCLVEVGDLKDGKVTMQPKVLPGCQTPVKDGTVIVTGEYAKRDPATPVAPALVQEVGESAPVEIR